MFSINIYNMNRVAEVNHLRRIVNPISLNMDRTPTEEGLFSFEIFGKPGSPERKITCAYIELYHKFLHPSYYKVLLQLNKNFERVVDGSRTFSVDKKGDLVEDEKGGTGLQWLYNNWNKLVFKAQRPSAEETDDISEMRIKRVSMLTNSLRDEIFMNKFPVMAPFYRDINFQKISSGVIMKDEVNNYYTKLINLASALQDSRSTIQIINSTTEVNIQNTLLELYEYLESKLAKKDGIIHNKLLSKAIDYSSRSVISAAPYNSSSYKNTFASYTHAGIPIAHCCSNFYPFLIRELERTFTESFSLWSELPDIDPMFRQEFTTNKIEKMIKRFIHDTHYRTSFLTAPSKKKGEVVYLSMKGPVVTPTYGPENRTTLLDLFFIIISNIVRDKHIYITRYPVDNYQNLSPMKINVLTTETVYENIFNDLKMFPKYDPINDKDIRFIDTVIMSGSYLASMGADFDGDTVSLRGVFSKEANEEAEKIMKSKISLIDSAGNTVRTMKQDGVLSLYMLTRE